MSVRSATNNAARPRRRSFSARPASKSARVDAASSASLRMTAVAPRRIHILKGFHGVLVRHLRGRDVDDEAGDAHGGALLRGEDVSLGVIVRPAAAEQLADGGDARGGGPRGDERARAREWIMILAKRTIARRRARACRGRRTVSSSTPRCARGSQRARACRAARGSARGMPCASRKWPRRTSRCDDIGIDEVPWYKWQRVTRRTMSDCDSQTHSNRALASTRRARKIIEKKACRNVRANADLTPRASRPATTTRASRLQYARRRRRHFTVLLQDDGLLPLGHLDRDWRDQCGRLLEPSAMSHRRGLRSNSPRARTSVGSARCAKLARRGGLDGAQDQEAIGRSSRGRWMPQLAEGQALPRRSEVQLSRVCCSGEKRRPEGVEAL